MNDRIRVILADDHQLVRKGFRALLEELDFVAVVGEAANGKEVVQLLRNGLKADVVLLDYEMPQMNGLEAAEIIQNDFLGLKTIMLTMLQSKELIQDAVAKNVKGFLFKNASLDELGEAIRRVHGGDVYFTGEVALALARPSAAASLPPILSDREIEVLRLVALGYSSAEIGAQLFISPRTVDTHRNNLIQKLDVRGIPGLVQFAIRHKLL